MNKNLYSNLISQYVTEKNNFLSDKYNHFVFKVSKYSNKYKIKKSVETIFNVLVKNVRIINVQGKIKLFKGKIGTRSDFKKAIVSLKKGYSINFSEF
ncbi:MAG TPA: 50S ribosomal protein L23 [Candidatus Azosocius sp. HAIN]